MRYEKKEPKIFDAPRLYSYAIWLLSRRDYSSAEMFKKMQKYQPDESMITSVIEKLVKSSYISEERVTINVIKSYSKRESSNKIRRRLIEKGIDKELINSSLEEELTSDSEKEIALSLLVKKFKTYNPEIRQKYVSFLAGKGYGWDIISKATSMFKTPEEE